jgi:hypothetical protein
MIASGPDLTRLSVPLRFDRHLVNEGVATFTFKSFFSSEYVRVALDEILFCSGTKAALTLRAWSIVT